MVTRRIEAANCRFNLLDAVFADTQPSWRLLSFPHQGDTQGSGVQWVCLAGDVVRDA
jgi:hypothetical protein